MDMQIMTTSNRGSIPYTGFNTNTITQLSGSVKKRREKRLEIENAESVVQSKKIWGMGSFWP